MKKFLAVFLTLALMLTCMAGCGEKEPEKTPTEAAGAATEAAAPVAAPAGEVVNITVMLRGGEGNVREAEVIAAMNEYSAEKIGVTINFRPVPAAEYKETLSREIAAKDDLDVVFAASYTDLHVLARQGGFMDLTDLLQQDDYADLRAVMPQEIWDASSIDGRNYCVPNYKETPFAESVFTPKALADTIKEKYGIDFNTIQVESFRDLDNLTEYLEACKQESVKYPVLANETDLSLSTLLKSDPQYETIGSNSFTPYVMNKQTHQVSNVYDNPDFDVYFETMAKWNELGLYHEDNISLDWDSRDAVMAVEYGIYPANAVPDNANAQSLAWGHEVYAINITPSTIMSTGTQGSTWAVPAYSKKSDAALKWIQLIETDHDFADLFIYGIEGVDYTRDSEDVITKLPDSGWKNSRWKVTCFETPSTQSTEAADLKQQYRDFNAMGEMAVLATFSPDFDPIKSEMASVNAIYTEEYHLYTLGFYNGDNRAASMERYKAAGNDTIIAELQSQIDTYLAG